MLYVFYISSRYLKHNIFLNVSIKVLRLFENMSLVDLRFSKVWYLSTWKFSKMCHIFILRFSFFENMSVIDLKFLKMCHLSWAFQKYFYVFSIKSGIFPFKVIPLFWSHPSSRVPLANINFCFRQLQLYCQKTFTWQVSVYLSEGLRFDKWRIKMFQTIFLWVFTIWYLEGGGST